MQNKDGLDDNYPSRKRQRVSKACDQCRRSKYKCDGKNPICQTCKKARRECTYGESIRKRGLQSGYVRYLEALFGTILQNVDGSNTIMKALIINRLTNRKLENVKVRDQLEEFDALVDHWKVSEIARMIERILAGEQDEEPEGVEMSEDDVRMGWDFHITTAITDDHPVTNEDRLSITVDELRSSNLSTQNIFPANQGSYDYTHLSTQDRGTLVLLPINAQTLLNRYVSLTHSWLPILERHELFRILFSYPPSGLCLTRKSPGSSGHAVLWAVLAHESFRSSSVESSTGESLFDSMFDMSLSLIPSVLERDLDIRHVQALLILGLTKFSTQDCELAWLLIGRAVFVARALGIDCTENTCQKSAERVWMGCLVLDTIVSAYHKRVPHLNPQAFLQQNVTTESALEEWEPWKGVSSIMSQEPYHGIKYSGPAHVLSVFNCLVKLCQIMNSALSGRASSTDLDVWIQNLPEFCKMTVLKDLDSHSEQFIMPHILNLRFTVYCCSTLVRHSTLTPSNPSKSQSNKSVNELLTALELFTETYGMLNKAAVYDLCALLARTSLSQHGAIADAGLLSRIEKLKYICNKGTPNLPLTSDLHSSIHAQQNPMTTPYSQALQSLDTLDSATSPIAACILPETTRVGSYVDDPSSLLDTNSAFDYFMSLDLPDSGNDQSRFMLNLGYLDHLS